MTLGPLAPLADYRQFIVYAAVPLPDGRTNKIPYSVHTGEVSNAHDSAAYVDYDTALATAAQWGERFGVGFVLTARDPFWCVDIDGCLAPTGWSQTALDIISLLPGAVCEVSRSGRGLHIWGRGPIPEHRSRNTALHLELYSDLRFIALGNTAAATGVLADTVPGIDLVVAGYFPPVVATDIAPHGDGPCPEWRGPTDDDDLIRRALRSSSAASTFGGGGVTFHDLWTRNVEALSRRWPADGTYDESSADAALATHLSFWTGRDQGRMERLMQRPDNGLRRDKYERADYLPRTINGAVSVGGSVCQDKALELPPGPRVEVPGPAPAASAPTEPAPGPSAPDDASGATFLNADHQRQLFAGCIYVQDQHRILIPGGTLLKPDQFKARFGGYTFLLDTRNEKTTRDAWEAFTQSQALRWPRADSVTFEPLHPYGALIEDSGQMLVNTWWPPVIRRVKGDPSPMLRHMRRLFPIERDFLILLYWKAAIVQNPGRKAQWAPVLQGVEGNGKTAFSTALAYAVGPRYVHWPAADKLDNQFNAWMYGKLLYCVEDLHKADIEKLKPMITQVTGFEIEKKGVDQFSAKVCGNWIFNSNHKDAIRKTRNDRRFAVLYCAQQTYEDLERQGMTGDFVKHNVYDWLNLQNGLAIWAEYLATLPIPDEFNPFTGCPRAPITSSTEEAIQASLGPAEQEVDEAVQSERVGFRGGWVSGVALDTLLREVSRAGAVPRSRRRAFMQGLGYDWHPALREGRTNNPVLPDGVKTVLYVHRENPDRNLLNPAEAAAAYSKAQGVSK